MARSEHETHLFVEASGGYDVVSSVGLGSGGAAIGVIHLFAADFGLGGTAGVEGAGRSVKSYGVEPLNESRKLYVDPKVALFGAVYS